MNRSRQFCETLCIKGVLWSKGGQGGATISILFTFLIIVQLKSLKPNAKITLEYPTTTNFSKASRHCRWPRFCQTQLQLANPTQLHLVGEGVDFVFQRKEEEEEGMKKKNTPHLASSRRNYPTCLKLNDCLVGVWNLFGNFWWVSGGCLVDVWRVS